MINVAKIASYVSSCSTCSCRRIECHCSQGEQVIGCESRASHRRRLGPRSCSNPR